ncbi:Uncharacterized protein APZ42_002405 [Daphnia magna]|uniref:Uncharacterized protein n=1 Tax=Daphnia magna TaxID=35525 RepID=A0A162CYR8_9CRUS|nr:Uncharacterized protein APZ42_002405 [Daphnia magna]
MQIEQIIHKLHIQVDNHCQFLPQEQVQNFSRMKDKQLLIGTMKVVGTLTKSKFLQADVMASTDRIKITSFIIEISKMDKNGDRQSLYGLLPLSKRLIIPTMEIIFTYLIIIYQFKAAAH